MNENERFFLHNSAASSFDFRLTFLTGSTAIDVEANKNTNRMQYNYYVRMNKSRVIAVVIWPFMLLCFVADHYWYTIQTHWVESFWRSLHVNEWKAEQAVRFLFVFTFVKKKSSNSRNQLSNYLFKIKRILFIFLCFDSLKFLFLLPL